MANEIKVLTLGYSGINDVGPTWVPDTIQRYPLGTTIEVVDPYWGPMELIYLKTVTRGASSIVGSIKSIGNNWEAIAVLSTSVIGQPLCVALHAATVDNNYDWFILRGRFPVQATYTNSISVGSKPGLSTSANRVKIASTGSGIQSMVVDVASASTNIDFGTIDNALVGIGTPTIQLFGELSAFDQGLFKGLILDGTGLDTSIGAGVAISSIDASGMAFTMGVPCIAAGNFSFRKMLGIGSPLTRKWGICTFNHPYVGAV